ncbi:PREDICTED: uncharacterized protein LOC105565322 [Vollenhovia emeryi]|uniref:uncharacterized protein LOC105565322 n=1 Tax=Vollenhovia emeryi TaxID=411798 RepID=UPI0005F463AB|nr:PREDICTED: uncharacterized protein LOC105565322 [Vollenhovia emeryi]
MERWHSYKRLDVANPSQLPEYRNVTEKTRDIIVLSNIKNMFEKYTHVRESDFIQEFNALDTIPSAIFNPKFVISKMLQRYFSNVTRIYKEPTFTQTFIFTYSAEDGEREFFFSNCMKFNEDVCIICFLHQIAESRVESENGDYHSFITCETAQILMKLMINKYGIDHESVPIENQFTIASIALSFPSITNDLFHNNIGLSVKFIIDSTLYFDLPELPKLIFLPLSVIVLPKLENPPLATLVAIMTKLRDRNTPAQTPRYSLQLIYDQVFLLYNTSIFPESLKVELCTKWNVVVKQNNEYTFAPCFEAYRYKAKCMIAASRPQDKSLNYILSKL